MATDSLKKLAPLVILLAVPLVLFSVLDFPLWVRIIAIVVQLALIATGSALLGVALKRSRYGQES